MRATKRGQKVVQGHLIGKVRDLHGSGDAPSPLGVEQIVGSDAEIEDVARFHAIRIVIVILLSRERSIATLWKGNELRSDSTQRAVWIGAVRNGCAHGSEYSIASQAD